jgi:hypothetical protein
LAIETVGLQDFLEGKVEAIAPIVVRVGGGVDALFEGVGVA